MIEQKIELEKKIEALKKSYIKNRKDISTFVLTIGILVIIAIGFFAVGYYLSDDKKNSPLLWVGLAFVIPAFSVGLVGTIYIFVKMYPTIILYRIIVENKKNWKNIARRWYSMKKIDKWLSYYNYTPDNEVVVE